MTRPFTIAAAQYPLDWLDDFAAYEAKLTRWVAEGAEGGSDLLVFPEYAGLELASLAGREASSDLQAAIQAVGRYLDKADALHARLHAEFSAEFDRVQAELARTYGEPLRTGAGDDDLIPLNGVFRFALWEVGDMVLFAAAAHEDRDCPLLLMLGTTGGDGA